MNKFQPGTRKILIFVFLVLYIAPGIKVFQKAIEDRTAFLRRTYHSERIKGKKNNLWRKRRPVPQSAMHDFNSHAFPRHGQCNRLPCMDDL